MQDVIQVSIDSLLLNACRLSEKAENSAMHNLIKGETDKVTHLATVRQLTGIVKQLKDRFDGQPRQEPREADNYQYPDW